MAKHQPTIFDIETLNAVSARLFDHADSIINVAAHEMEKDIRWRRQKRTRRTSRATPFCFRKGVAQVARRVMADRLIMALVRLLPRDSATQLPE